MFNLQLLVLMLLHEHVVRQDVSQCPVALRESSGCPNTQEEDFCIFIVDVHKLHIKQQYIFSFSCLLATLKVKLNVLPGLSHDAKHLKNIIIQQKCL